MRFEQASYVPSSVVVEPARINDTDDLMHANANAMLQVKTSVSLIAMTARDKCSGGAMNASRKG